MITSEIMTVDGLSQAMLSADPRVARFNPLPRLIALDDFNSGLHGWTELIGNYNARGDLDSVTAHMVDFRPPQLSSATFFDVGTHGALSGTYSMKLATRPLAGHTAVAIRRLTMAQRGLVQLETHFAYKAEAHSEENQAARQAGTGSWDGNVHPSEQQFGAFTLGSDLCDPDGVRYHCVLRYQNTATDAGSFVRSWRYPLIPEPTPRDHLAGKIALTTTDDFTAPGAENWADLDDGIQSFCFNEVPTKINWHYLRWQIDTEARRNVELQVNDRLYDLSNVPVSPYEERYEALENLLNFYISVRTHTNVRNFLFLDSVLVSVDW